MSLIKKADFIVSKKDYGKVCPSFAKEFTLKGNVKKATLQVSAFGVYNAYVNGEKVGDYILAPGWTAYQSRLQYQTYDITAMLKEDNFIEINLGWGWAVKNLAHFGVIPWKPHATQPVLIAAVEVEYENGDVDTILTDDSWKASMSEILLSQIYDGEVVDCRIADERNWEEVRVFPYPRDILIEQEGEIVREIEVLDAKEIITTPKGETVIDFGQEITGYVEFTPKGNYGDEIQIHHAEVLDAEGNFYTDNLRSAKAQISYICGKENKKYKPNHTFYGFRYIRLTKWAGEVDKANFKAIVVHSDMKRTGYFECSDPMVNKLYSNVIWGQRGNFLDVPTDCPQRDERLGWTGDANVFFKTAALNYDVEKFFKKWLRDLRAEQFYNGAVPCVIPNVLRNNPTDDFFSSSYWGDASCVIPWEMYLAYGDKEFLKDQYFSMQRYVDYMRNSGECEFLHDDFYHYSDWLALDGVYDCHENDLDKDYKVILATGAYAGSVDILIKAGRVLGIDVSEYEKLHENIVKTYNERFIIDGDVKYKTQTMYVVAIHFNLVKDKALYAKRLADLIKANGNRLTTGFVGTAYLMQTLTENGYTDVAYSLLLQQEFPSWLFSVRMGATTIWEHWDSVREDGTMWSTEMNSFNHYAYGAVASWMYGTMGGINYDESNPAYKHIIIKPIPDKRIEWVKTSLDSRNGLIKSAWKYDGDKFTYNISIPDGATATIILGDDTYEVNGGDYEYVK